MKIDIENKEFRKSRHKSIPNPLWSITWRFLLFCLIIDGGVYFYFHEIENISVSEGIKRIRSRVHVNKDPVSQNIHNINVYVPADFNKTAKGSGSDIGTNTKKMVVSNLSYPVKQRNTPVNKKIKERFYCWKDKNGRIHYSNIGYPTKGYYEIVRNE
jgi:hypothetical protein